MSQRTQLIEKLERLRRLCLISAIVGIVLVIVGFAMLVFGFPARDTSSGALAVFIIGFDAPGAYAALRMRWRAGQIIARQGTTEPNP